MIKKLVPPVMALAIIGGAGLSLIKSSEGLRTTSYRDPVGIPTICYGHTGPEVRPGQRVSAQYCDAILKQDIAAHQAYLIGPRNCIGNAPLNQNQLDALTSFTFNIGGPKFCKSTMAAKLKLRDYAGASKEFPKWANASVDGKLTRLPGLSKRRTEEQILFGTRMPPTPVRALVGSAGHGRAISTGKGKS